MICEFGEIEQDVEIVGRRVAAGEMAGKAAGIDASLDTPANVEEAPAGAAVHVFLSEARDRGDGPQRRVGTLKASASASGGILSTARLRRVRRSAARCRRKPLADDRGGASRVAHERQSGAIILLAVQTRRHKAPWGRRRPLRRRMPGNEQAASLDDGQPRLAAPASVSIMRLARQRISRKVASARSR